uniref:Uncharacterized protein n=1 Tax=Anguilla anguilla TaxID=7936 RepID=A0A0E9VD67_ANGAN
METQIGTIHTNVVVSYVCIGHYLNKVAQSKVISISFPSYCLLITARSAFQLIHPSAQIKFETQS